MIKRKIIFRADGGPTIGMGHFFRTLALAQMLKDDFYCVFATRNPSFFQVHEIKKVCHEIIILSDNNSHFKEFLSFLNGDEIIVLDNYYFSTEYQKEIKDKGCQLVCIDDLQDKHYVADIVINHAEGIDASKFSIESYTRLLLGYKYALLRPSFVLSNDFQWEKIYSAIIAIGGADPLALSEKILKLCLKYGFSKPIIVINGRKIKNKVTNSNVIFFNDLTDSQLMNLMQKSEFGVFPASTVAIEACAARLPFLCGFFVENQKEVYKGIINSKLAIGIGDFLSLDQLAFDNAIRRLLKKGTYDNIMSRQKALLDKQSAERIKNVFLEL